jgi:hypothetical protein
MKNLLLSSMLLTVGLFASETVKFRNFDNYLSYLEKIEIENLVEFVGYSGAGYEDQVAFEADMVTLSKKLSKKGKTAFMFGGTSSGIGAGYTLLKAALPSERDFHITGMVSNQAEIKNYLSDKNESVFLVNSYEGWALKEKETDSSLTQVVLQKSCSMFKRTNLIVLEGGQQAMEEVLELLQEASNKEFKCKFNRKIRVNIVMGYTPKPEKVKEGRVYQAATKLAIILKNDDLIKKYGLDMNQINKRIKFNFYKKSNPTAEFKKKLTKVKCIKHSKIANEEEHKNDFISKLTKMEVAQ